MKNRIPAVKVLAALAAALLFSAIGSVTALADHVQYPKQPDEDIVWLFISGGAFLVIVAAVLFLIIAAHRKKKN